MFSTSTRGMVLRACSLFTIFAFVFLINTNEAYAQFPILTDLLADSDGDGVPNGTDLAPADPCIPLDSDANCCTHFGDEISVSSAGANTDADHTASYAITDANGVIEAVESTPSFTNLAFGLHHIYGINYETVSGITGLTVGGNIANVTGDCFTISDEPLIVHNCDDSPVFNNPEFAGGNNSVDYDENGTDPVITLDATTPTGGTVTYTFTASGNGTDNGDFTLDANTGVLNFVNSPNAEQPEDDDTDNVYIVEVEACAGTNCTIQLITVNVIDVCEAATITLSLN